MNRKKTLLLAAGLVLVLLLAVLGYKLLAPRYTPGVSAPSAQENGAPEPSPTAAPQVIAPDFTVLDAEGGEVSLSDFSGKPVVLNFWATWCGPCKSELPTFDEAYARYGQEVVFMMIDLTDGSRETQEGVEAFLEQNGYAFPVYYDTDLSAALAYGASSIPLTVFVNADGTILTGYIGPVPEKTLEECIGTLLANGENN